MNTTSHALDPTAAAKPRGELGEVSLPNGWDPSALERARVLRASQLELTSLVVSPESSLSTVVQDITTLDVSQNRISSLHGLQAFPALEVLNLRHNLLHVLDGAAVSPLRGLTRLRSLDLAHNGLVELPDLRALLSLQLLDLSHNHLEDLTGLDTRLPLLGLHTLRLSHNRIRGVSGLVGLSALAAALRQVELDGNPFTAVAAGGGKPAGWWRPFVLWLLPLTMSLDGVGYTWPEQQVALRLFRERGALTKRLLKLMNPSFQKELMDYLLEQGRGFLTPAEPRKAFEASNGAVRGGGGSSIATQRSFFVETADDCRIPSLEPKHLVVNSSVAAQTRRTAPVAIILRAIQDKLRSLSDVVQVLWKQDIARRNRAAITIQRHVRAAFAWKRLTEEKKEYCRAIRSQIARRKWYAYRTKTFDSDCATQHLNDAASDETARMVSNAAATSLADREVATVTKKGELAQMESCAAGMSEVVNTMRSLQEVMMTMWEDLDHFRAMASREQRRAATNIQRVYRGYVSRKAWRELKAGYDEFVSSIEVYILILQRCGRGCLGRLKIAEQNRYRQEVHQLRKEVVELRHETREMRSIMESFMRQQRLSQHVDPEKAMDEIMEQYARGA
ncbi:unnamed protein product [Phytomonas sp. EM1]|nr:unnamed protein product [Phytomonas sp. EM1]|eukprot:CCW62242.1 unnamed protein product [Phytomonas sp. isolate EM1]